MTTLAPTAEDEETSRSPADVFMARFARRAVPTLVFAGLLAVLMQVAALPLVNTDTYFHLRFGEEFLRGWSLRHPGSVSTYATSPWLPTQWLPEIVMAKTDQWFGLAGVAWLFGVQLTVLLVSLYLVARHWTQPLTVLALAISAMSASYYALSMRPQVLSYALVVVTTGAWLRTRDDQRLRWWLIPVTWVWAMCHGMWPIGIGIGVVAVVGLALDHRLARRELALALLIPSLSAVAAALTPVGPGLYGAVLAVGRRSHFFSEWATPDFHSPALIVFGLMLAATTLMVIRQDRSNWTDLLFLAVVAACGVWSSRTVPVAAMMLMPIAGVQLGRLSHRPDPGPSRQERLLVAGGAAVALAALALVVPHTSANPLSEPGWVDPALSSLAAGTPVVSDWGLGGYLMWRYPQLDPLMHGYGDTFTVAELQRNTDIMDLAPGWDVKLKQTGCRIAVLNPTSRLAYALTHQEGWTVLHRSAAIEELRAPAGWSSATS